MKKPTKKELAAFKRIYREKAKLDLEKDRLKRLLIEKYVPCQPGDIIEGGKNERDKGVVCFRECYVCNDGTCDFRVSYYPIRGKRRLRTRRTFHFMETIKVLQKATPHTRNMATPGRHDLTL